MRNRAELLWHTASRHCVVSCFVCRLSGYANCVEQDFFQESQGEKIAVLQHFLKKLSAISNFDQGGLNQR
ncbi:hypothetical protein AB833_25520 [Chromatiales bacterium (ex Bugula neritina AB1)]|nr:hypothetical protein AB833_25520 [Chromatiales bacterium (ex Bugula neritina AB1)]